MLGILDRDDLDDDSLGAEWNEEQKSLLLEIVERARTDGIPEFLCTENTNEDELDGSEEDDYGTETVNRMAYLGFSISHGKRRAKDNDLIGRVVIELFFDVV